MPSKLTSYKIFVASPGGLEDERKVFRDVINSYNDTEAIPRGAHFVPVGWEITLRGVGRAQEKINDEVRQCDFFVLLLWDRWGTPTGSSKHHTSGTEEEYDVAWDCYNDSKRAMREIIVFFKAVTPRQLSDPGEQLLRVLNFKKKLEAEKKLFFDTFDDTSAFGDKFRKYLALWMRLHESDEPAKVKVPSLPIAGSKNKLPDDFAAVNPTNPPHAQGVNDFLKGARSLAGRGKITEAEGLFTKAISRFDDPNAFNAYGDFLLAQHRWTQAEAMFRDLLKVAEATKSEKWIAFAYSKLSATYVLLKNYEQAIKSLQQSLQIYETLSDSKMIALTSGSLVRLLLKANQPEAAKVFAERALGLSISLGDWRGAGDASHALVSVMKATNDRTSMIQYLDKAIQYYNKAKKQGLASEARKWRKHVMKEKK
jgi:tetratricopeptide (TPR) repeat protein